MRPWKISNTGTITSSKVRTSWSESMPATTSSTNSTTSSGSETQWLCKKPRRKKLYQRQQETKKQEAGKNKYKRKEKVRPKRAECWTYVLHWNHPAAGPEAVRRHSDWCRSLGWAGLSVCSKPSGSYSEQQMTVTSLVPWSPGVQIIKSRNYERAWVIFMFQFPRIVYYQLATSENSCIKVLK